MFVRTNLKHFIATNKLFSIAGVPPLLRLPCSYYTVQKNLVKVELTKYGKVFLSRPLLHSVIILGLQDNQYLVLTTKCCQPKLLKMCTFLVFCVQWYAVINLFLRGQGSMNGLKSIIGLFIFGHWVYIEDIEEDSCVSKTLCIIQIKWLEFPPLFLSVTTFHRRHSSL